MSSDCCWDQDELRLRYRWALLAWECSERPLPSPPSSRLQAPRLCLCSSVSRFLLWVLCVCVAPRLWGCLKKMLECFWTCKHAAFLWIAAQCWRDSQPRLTDQNRRDFSQEYRFEMKKNSCRRRFIRSLVNQMFNLNKVTGNMWWRSEVELKLFFSLDLPEETQFHWTSFCGRISWILIQEVCWSRTEVWLLCCSDRTPQHERGCSLSSYRRRFSSTFWSKLYLHYYGFLN